MGSKIGYDIIVNEDNCKQIGETYMSYAEAFEVKLENYIASLDRILDGAVKSGKVANNLEIFSGECKNLKTMLNQMSEEAKNEINSFVADIDAADKELF